MCAIAFIVAASAWAGGQQEGEAAASAEPVVLQVTTHLSNEDTGSQFVELCNQFAEENPGVAKVEHTPTQYGELQARVATDRMADDPPDVYLLPAWWVGNLVETGITSTPPMEIIEFVKENCPPSVIDTVTYNDQIWGIPMDNNPTLLIVKKAALEEAGFDRPPETLNELYEYAGKMTKRDADGNVTQYGFSEWVGNLNNQFLPFMSFLFSNGGSMWDPETGLSAFNKPEGVEILQLWMKMIDDGIFNPELTYADWYEGRVAMTVLPNWVRYYLLTYNDPQAYMSAPMPHGQGEESGAITYSWFAFANANSEHQQEAWEFCYWYNKPRDGEPSYAADFYFSNWGVIPASYPDLEALSEEFQTDFMAAFVKSHEYAQAPLAPPSYNEIVEILNTEIQKAWFKEKSPKQALDDAAREADALIQAP